MPLLSFEVPEPDSPLVVQELQIGGTRRPILTFVSFSATAFANVRIVGSLANIGF